MRSLAHDSRWRVASLWNVFHKINTIYSTVRSYGVRRKAFFGGQGFPWWTLRALPNLVKRFPDCVCDANKRCCAKDIFLKVW
jgi:hypothetical protein